MTEIIYKAESYAIIGACFEVDERIAKTQRAKPKPDFSDVSP
jgi:hypothetical protein